MGSISKQFEPKKVQYSKMFQKKTIIQQLEKKISHQFVDFCKIFESLIKLLGVISNM